MYVNGIQLLATKSELFPALTFDNEVVIPAVVRGVPTVFFNTITPPPVWLITILPVLFTLAVICDSPNASRSDTKDAASVPLSVTVCTVLSVLLAGTLC